MLKALLPQKVNDAVRLEQIRLLHLQGSTIQLLGLLTAFISVLAFWNIADHSQLMAWFSIMLVLSLLRLHFTNVFNRGDVKEPEDIQRWGTIYVIGTLLSGIAWGGLAFIYEPTWPAAYQVILFVLFTGIIAGAFNTNTPLFIAFPAFYLPPVSCLMYVMLQQGSEGFFELTALFGIYIALMYVSALKFHNRLAESLSRRLENEQLNKELIDANIQLLRLAEIDELTKLYNRRSMDKYLSSEWNRHYRSQKPLSLLFVDIDFFKQYNDTYGHDGGDKCLSKIAKLLQKNAHRSSDMAARFGGEEFAIILPETTIEDALKVAEKIRYETELLNIPHANSSVSNVVTLSIGAISMVPHHIDDWKILWTKADQALYKAKESGRNQVVSDNDYTLTVHLR